jgi:hypothetical protein
MLLSRLDALIARCEQVQQTVQAAASDTRLPTRIAASLTGRLAEQLAGLKKRRKAVAADTSVSDWDVVDATVHDRLFDECLSYVQAARSRAAGVEADLGEITDALLSELTSKFATLTWKSYCTFAIEDSFDAHTDIIRIRYPLATVWDVAVGVHEFGHFASRRITAKRSDGSHVLALETHKQAVVMQKEAAGTSVAGSVDVAIDWGTYVDELFADVFATYALGPAFAFSTILLRFDPLTSTIDLDGKHPSYAIRTFAILRTLRRMNVAAGRVGQLADAIQLLESSWKSACKAAGTNPLPRESDQDWIDGQVSTIHGVLRDSEPGLEFDGWETARLNANLLLAATADPASATALSIVQLLNAAWIAWSKPGSDANVIHRNFVALARTTAGRRLTEVR